jgi:4-alpha-glucanotransferase
MVDVCNISGAEVMLCHAQVIEHAYLQDAPQSQVQGQKSEGQQKGAGLLLESDVFAGVHRDSGEVILRRELLDYVAKEV